MSWWKPVARLVFLGMLLATMLTPGLGTSVFGRPHHPQSHHDVAVIALQAPATARIGDLLRVNVTLVNYGSSMETVRVQLLANQTRILAAGSVSFNPLSSVIIDLLWNTTGYPASTYQLSALALPVPGETNLANNSTGPVIVVLREPSTGPTPTSSLPGFGLATEEVILISLGEAVLGLYIIGRRMSGKPKRPSAKNQALATGQDLYQRRNELLVIVTGQLT
jgi:hypothetical protein